MEEGVPFLGVCSALVALTSKLLSKEPCLCMHCPRLSPLTLPSRPPAMLHFFVIELRVCPPSCSQCSHHRFSGTNSQGILSGFNKTVLKTLPRSRNLIVVESVLMAVAFVAMLLVRPRTGVGVGGWEGGEWGGVNEVWGLRRGK